MAQCSAQVIYLKQLKINLPHNRLETLQLYSYLTYIGSRIEDITCVGHSLGAHICGMISNHLTQKQHRIIGK